MTDWDRLVSTAKVVELHRLGLQQYGGRSVKPADECVEGSLGNAWTAELYQRESPFRCEGLAFAGYVLLYLARNHCFEDGNKRAAWLVAMYGSWKARPIGAGDR